MKQPPDESTSQETWVYEASLHIDQVCDEFVRAWRSGGRPRIEDYLNRALGEERAVLLLELLREELSLRRQLSEPVSINDYQSRFPGNPETIARAFSLTEQASSYSTQALGESTHGSERPESASANTYVEGERYRRLRQLGAGAFGTVWLAEDLELERLVALKEPRLDRSHNKLDIEKYLAEARILASLDHPHIVPVYDVGRTATGSCYVVSKWIDGLSLNAYVAQTTLSLEMIVELLAHVADALQQTHHRGLVHRDIKPANILIDRYGRPYVTDFGLALREEDFDKHDGITGTPAYMSPEQARGEGHRVDGRSDLFSLGIVMYELLTGQRPFQGSNWVEIIRQLTTAEPSPPRSLNDRIPSELERICMRALSKRSVDRYATAREMSDELRHWLMDIRRSSAGASGILLESHSKNASTIKSKPYQEKTMAIHSVDPEGDGIYVVPRGLRSFDQHDADFFLSLLPGPRDRHGLPESVRWWKQRLEENDSSLTFRIGLMYGPSGCGKSSLMKAGVLPHLAPNISYAFVEATPDTTEVQVLRAIQRTCGGEVSGMKLPAALAAIRRGAGLPENHKLVLVLDQFEQWLFSHPWDRNSELSDALRQCDGGRVQAVILVRDDFWMPVTRFLDDQEIRFLQGENAWAVDLLDPNHARKVLAGFGRAYGKLPGREREQSSSQDAFLDAAVEGLAEEGRVICVRLALFAEMLKNREWNPASLRALGGTVGVGTAFLEEMFGSRSTSPRHRRQEYAARLFLHALLPQARTEIRGNRKTIQDLRDVTGYSNRSREFQDLLLILDNELRLITPVGDESDSSEKLQVQELVETSKSSTDTSPPTPVTVYQLTHDYLVPSIREWITRSQKETTSGRATLRLHELTADWSATHENRHLPSLREDLTFRLLTKRKRWSTPARQMMARSGWFHGVRIALLSVCTLGIGLMLRWYSDTAARNRSYLELTDRSQEEWSQDHFEKTLSLAEELDQRDPPRSRGTRRQKVLDGMANYVRSQLKRDRVEPADVPRLEERIQWLADFDLPAAKKLTEELAGRLEKWQQSILIEQPFENIEKHFLVKQVKAGPEGLIRGEDQNLYVPIDGVSSTGRKQISLELGEDWSRSSFLGILLHYQSESIENGPASHDYEFRMVPSTLAKSVELLNDLTLVPNPAPSDFQQSGYRAQIGIVRRGEVLQQTQIQLNPNGKLRLEAQRDSERLRFRVNSAVIEFNDLFPLSGNPQSRIALAWPVGVSVSKLIVEDVSAPELPSPFEKADKFFEEKQWDSALQEYRAYALTASAGNAEAMCKQGICSKNLDRLDEAEQVLQEVQLLSVDNPSNEKWKTIAAAQQWLINIEKQDFTQTKDLTTTLLSRFGEGGFSKFLSFEQRSEIALKLRPFPLLRLLNNASDASVLRSEIEAMCDTGQLLGLFDTVVQANQANLNMLDLLEGRYADVKDRSKKQIDSHLRQLAINEGFTWEDLCFNARDLSWALRLDDQTDKAIEEVSLLQQQIRSLQEKNPDNPVGGYWRFSKLRLEQAKNFAAKGRWEEADAEVQKYFDELTEKELAEEHYMFYSQSHLLKGLFADKRGDHDTAMKYWRNGLWSSYQALNPSAQGDCPPGLAGMCDHWIMASWTDSLKDADADALIKAVFKRAFGDESRMSSIPRLLSLSPETLRKTWRSSRGHEIAEDYALSRQPHLTIYRDIINLGGTQYVLSKIIDGEPSQDEYEVVFMSMEQLLDNYFKGKLRFEQIPFLLAALKASKGWNASWWVVRKQLDEIKATPSFAYLMGMRLRKSEPNESRNMFDLVIKQAPENSKLRKLAELELQRLEKPH